MSVRGLQMLVGKAVVSEAFRDGMLNGRGAELIKNFDLEPSEAAGVMAIRADTLEAFAAAIDQLAYPSDYTGWHVTDRPALMLDRPLPQWPIPVRGETSSRFEGWLSPGV